MSKISVIVPSFQPGDYIFKGLDILFNMQSLDSSLYEVIIVLNGGKEPFYTNLENYIGERTNVVLIYTEEAGVSNARNIGISKAKGEFLTFIDDDDYISNTFLEDLYSAFEGDNIVDIVQSNFKVDTRGVLTDDYISRAYTSLYTKPYSLLLYRKFLSSVCAKLYRRSIIGDIRFDTTLQISEDSVFLFKISKNIQKIALSKSTCIYYRSVREGSALRSKRPFFEILRNYSRKIVKYSEIYLEAPLKYNFGFYFSRIAAISKILISEIKDNSKR